jgi:membrane-bound lytic murein transglycosylase D
VAPVALDTERDADLYARIVRGFKMPDLPSPIVAEKERSYLANPAYLNRMFTRGNRYMFHIVEELEKRGMPTELALLPMVESAMNPVAASHAKAVGLWQFIPSTGKAFNLQQNWWVDNRRDVLQSTRAALDYLQKIYEMQGNDWFLGLASYNWGEGAVKRAVSRAKAAGKPGDYLSLDMPLETRQYVPKLIALKQILLRSKELNLSLPELPNKPYFVMIEKTRPIDLKLAAKFAGMTVEEFVALNPAHNRPVIAASKNNQIILPAERLTPFVKAVDEHETSNKVFASWQPYTLKSGESLEQIATRGKVTLAELRKANSLRDHQRILPGTRIIAPQHSVQDEKAVESFVAPRVFEAVSVPPAYHTVSKRDTVQSVASRYGISVAALRAWNGLKKGVKKGMQLVVRQPSSNTVLTTETGARQVVSNHQTATIKLVAKAPVEKIKPGKKGKVKATARNGSSDTKKVAAKTSVKKVKRS